MEIRVVATDCCAWPVLTALPDGSAGVVHFNRPSHGLEEGDLVARVTTDSGASWTAAGTAAPHEPGCNRMHAAAGLDHAGRWIVLSTGFRVGDPPFTELRPLWISRRQPDGVWTSTPGVTPGQPEPFLIPHGRISALPDGRLGATFYRSEGKGRPSRAWLGFSTDHGHSWQGWRQIGNGDENEVVLLSRPTAPWLAAARTHDDHHVRLFASEDAGQSWCATADLTLPMQHPGDLTDLGDDGVLLTYGIRNRGLMGVGLRLSRDGGRRWGAPAVLAQFGEATDCGYPSTVRLADGTLLTCAYSDLSASHRGYHLLGFRWRLEDFTQPRPLRAISDQRALET